MCRFILFFSLIYLQQYIMLQTFKIDFVSRLTKRLLPCGCMTPVNYQHTIDKIFNIMFERRRIRGVEALLFEIVT